MKNSIILIVDDEPAGRDTLEALLFGRGYELFFAACGEEALKKASEIKPDLILLDVMMPEMDGFEVCRLLRQDPVVSEVPVIMVTALDDRDSRLQGIEAGADDFISKPYDIAELRTRIKTITRLNRYRRLLYEREKFAWVVEHSGEGYLIINSNDRILYANSRARDYLGLQDSSYPSEESFIDIAKREYSLKPEEIWNYWPHIDEENIKYPRYLLRPATENSDVFWLQVELIEMSSDSSFSEYLIRLNDVTEEIVSRTNTWTFHSMVAHKLRTPIASLDSILELLKFDPTMLSTEDLKEFVLDAHHSTFRIKNQVEEILLSLEKREVLKPEEGQCTIIDILKFINNLKVDLKLEKVVINTDKLDKESRVISFSSTAMELVLREILVNSKKFHPHRDPAIEISIEETLEGIKLKISDDGISLSPGQLSGMWFPYYQAERYFTGEVAGMGLGLWTVASMVWNGRGTCRSYNRHNGPGIVVEIVLPEKAWVVKSEQ